MNSVRVLETHSSPQYLPRDSDNDVSCRNMMFLGPNSGTIDLVFGVIERIDGDVCRIPLLVLREL
jgi:hypothetical protein